MTAQKRILAWPLILTFLIILGWMPFEGIFWLVTSVGTSLTLLWAWVLHHHYKNQVIQRFSGTPAVVGYWALTGSMAGLIAPAMILGLMILKTGIHSHGAEFSPAEIEWVLSQFLRWGGLGLIIGLGIGLIVSALNDS